MTCPFDANHSCDVKKLKKHLEKCPSRPTVLPDYIQIGVNTAQNSGDETRLRLFDVPDEKILQIVNRVNEIYDDKIRMETEIRAHLIVEEEMSRNASFFGPEVLKHLVQNSSLLGNLDAKGLLNVSMKFAFFIVFSCIILYSMVYGNFVFNIRLSEWISAVN